MKKLIYPIAQLESQLFPEDAWTADSITDLLKNPINDVIVLQKNEELLGYCIYQIVFETAEILRIGVNPSYQNQGIGSQIITQLLEKLIPHSVENLLLEVRADNFNAMGFYQKHGFNAIHLRKQYYLLKTGGMVDAVIMQKILPP